MDEKCRILSMTQTGGHSLTKELVLLCSKEFLEQQMNENKLTTIFNSLCETRRLQRRDYSKSQIYKQDW